MHGDAGLAGDNQIPTSDAAPRRLTARAFKSLGWGRDFVLWTQSSMTRHITQVVPHARSALERRHGFGFACRVSGRDGR